MCVEFYEVKFIDHIEAYNLKLLMRKALSRVPGVGEAALDKWVVPGLEGEAWRGCRA